MRRIRVLEYRCDAVCGPLQPGRRHLVDSPTGIDHMPSPGTEIVVTKAIVEEVEE